MTIAIDLIKAGYKVFPCNDDKTPRVKAWQKNATNDPATVKNWQKYQSPKLWGIPAAVNGFFAVDIDPDGIDTWKGWVNGSTNSGPEQNTPRGGMHILYKLPPDIKIPNNAGKLAPGIDLRSNGYICTGAGYTWQAGHDYTAPLQDAPAWLLDKIRAMNNKPVMDMRIGTTELVDPDAAGEYWLNRALEQARPGNRNETGFWLALQLRDSGINQNQAAVIMANYAARVPGKDYTTGEAITSLNEAYRGTPREPANIPVRKVQSMAADKEKIYTLDISAPPPQIREFVRGFECTDTGNGHRFTEIHGKEVRWVESAGAWFIWDGTRWAKDDNGEAERRAKATAKSIHFEAHEETDKNKEKSLTSWAIRSQSRSQITNMLELAKSEPGITIPFDHFDRNQYLLNFKNGTLDLKTGALKPHHPGDFITKLIDLDYNEKAQCPRWLQFLNEITDHNRALITFLQRAAGYSLTGDTGDQSFFICYGRGANGKTVFIETLLNALGADYGINTRANTILIKDRTNGVNNDVARLRGLRFVTVNEIPGRGRLDEAKIKEMTGGDTITARYLFHEDFSFKPEFKLWVRTNHKPIITGVDYGIWRRVKLIPFTVTIPQEKQDAKLQEKLREEWPGILAWAVMGCLVWQDDGLTDPEEVRAATQEYKREQDTMQPFIDDRCEINKMESVKASDLYAAYRAWAETNGEKAMTSTAFGRELSERGYEKRRQGQDRALTYTGIGIKK